MVGGCMYVCACFDVCTWKWVMCGGWDVCAYSIYVCVVSVMFVHGSV